MHLLRVCLLVGLWFSGQALAADVEIVRVWPGYREAERFLGIGEHFGGNEPAARRILLRTQPADRGGFYWLARFKTAQPVEQAVLELAVLRRGQAEPVVHQFPFLLPAGSHPVLAGLTGSDWTDPRERPVAWRLRLLDAASGAELAAEPSFLWADPPDTP